MVKWFQRFADVPGVNFEGSPNVDRTKLPEFGVVPKIEDDEDESAWWPSPRGSTDATPAAQRSEAAHEIESTKGIIRNVYEGLEVPGEPSDYHFLIQDASERLRLRRRDELGVLQEVEKLCLLDLQLIEAFPSAIRSEYDEEGRYYNILAFHTLIGLYETEGALWEALAVAERAAKFGQESEARDRLLDRISELEAEDQSDE